MVVFLVRMGIPMRVSVFVIMVVFLVRMGIPMRVSVLVIMVVFLVRMGIPMLVLIGMFVLMVMVAMLMNRPDTLHTGQYQAVEYAVIRLQDTGDSIGGIVMGLAATRWAEAMDTSEVIAHFKPAAAGCLGPQYRLHWTPP